MSVNEKTKQVLNYVLAEDEIEITTEDEEIKLSKKDIGLLSLPTGKIVACDPIVCGQLTEFRRTVHPGSYPVSVYIARIDGFDTRVALASLRFSDKKPVKWEMALKEGQNIEELEDGYIFGYAVDAGTGGFMDKAAADKIDETDIDMFDMLDDTLFNDDHKPYGIVSVTGENDVAAFLSGYGDGYYASYFGIDEDGNLCILVTDFDIL